MVQMYRTPGVYVEEVSSGLRPMEAVGTSTAGFVGIAPDRGAHLHEPRSILNYSQFRRELGSDRDGNPLPESTDLSRAVLGFFLNGGQLCYVVNVGADGTGTLPGAPGSGQGLDALSRIEDVAIVAAPGYTDAASYDLLISHCELRKDRVAILDGPPPERFPDDVGELTKVATAGAPAPAPAPAGGSGSSASGDGEDEEAGGTGPSRPITAAAAAGGFKPRASERGFAAFYVPWLVTIGEVDGERQLTPPSGHLAGIWARTDAERGVHTAPANTPVRGCIGLSRHITSAEQALLNPEGVNCIRHFSGEGTLVWGARTIASDPEWKYVNVRRLFCMIEQTILANTRWAVFQPNSQPLWKSIERSVRAFLMRVWRSGALVGTSPEQAFFVQCDAETNPPDLRDAGMVVTVVGVAPAKPAEFVVFQLTQHTDGGESIAEGEG